MRFILFGIVFLFASNGASQANVYDEAMLKSYAYSSEWLNLLYFEKTSTGFKSLVTTRAFFVSDVGDHDPLSELRSTIELFSASQTTSMNPQCAYPARYEVLKRRFKLQDPVACPQLDTWLASYEPQSIEIVYTSPFISNPASVFGHAFLLVSSNKQVEALWKTFNFAAAIPSDVNPFAYAWGGLTGWYSGDYSILPYYQRLYQYGSIENRDLWRYPLNLTKSELFTLIKHFWEVVHLARFRYYFLDENCAGYILKSLAAVLPDMADTSNVSIYVHPVDVIRTLKSSNRLGEATRVPSNFEIFRTRFDRLTSSDRAIFFQIIDLKRDIAPEENLEVLESVVDFLSLERTRNNGELSGNMATLERKVFIARAKRPPRTDPEVAAVKQPPHLSHESMRVSFGVSNRSDIRHLELGYRLAIHDLLEDDAGFLQDSSVEAFSGRISASRNKGKIKIGLKDLTILKIENYPEFYRADPKGSWLIHLGLHENPFNTQSKRYQSFGHLAYGGATSLLSGLAFSMLSTELFNYGPQSPFYMGVEGGLLFDFDFGHVMMRMNLSTDPLRHGQNPKLNGQVGFGLPFNRHNSVMLNGGRECLYKSGLCHVNLGAEWRIYF